MVEKKKENIKYKAIIIQYRRYLLNQNMDVPKISFSSQNVPDEEEQLFNYPSAHSLDINYPIKLTPVK